MVDCRPLPDAIGKDLFPFLLGEDVLEKLVRCNMMHRLKQYKDIHCIPRPGESFLLVRKKNLGLSNSSHPAFAMDSDF